MDPIDLLEQLCVLNLDNGRYFTEDTRLRAIRQCLQDSTYSQCFRGSLFHLYSQAPVEELPQPLLLVSSHVDCEQHITRCFSEQDGDLLHGTYDNAITNTAAVALMKSTALPPQVVFAFTGDEEENSQGAIEIASFLKSHGIQFRVVVLDVTDQAWELADFTVENNFWKDRWGKRIASALTQLPYTWRFVPEAPDAIPPYIPDAFCIHKEAEPDESWDYDELGAECFSFCLPVKGEMHSNAGVYARQSSFLHYIKALGALIERI